MDLHSLMKKDKFQVEIRGHFGFHEETFSGGFWGKSGTKFAFLTSRFLGDEMFKKNYKTTTEPTVCIRIQGRGSILCSKLVQ